MSFGNQLQLSSTLQQLLKQFYIPSLLYYSLVLNTPNTNDQLFPLKNIIKENTIPVIKEEYNDSEAKNHQHSDCSTKTVQKIGRKNKFDKNLLSNKLENSQKYEEPSKTKKIKK